MTCASSMGRLGMSRALAALAALAIAGSAIATQNADAPARSAAKGQAASSAPAVDARIVNAPPRVEAKLPDAPLRIEGEVVARRSKEDAEADAESEKAKAGADSQLIKATWALVACTAALFIATGFLWWATYKLGKDAKAEGEERTKEMRESLDTAASMAESAAKQVALLGAQVDNAAKQTAIARQEFLTAHRPSLLARHFELDPGKRILPGEEFGWQISIFNTGSSAAKNIAITYSSIWAKTWQDAARVADAFPMSHQAGRDLEPGHLIKQSLPHKRTAPTESGTQGFIHLYMLTFFVIGRISYEDALGLTRNTGFIYEAFHENESGRSIGGDPKLKGTITAHLVVRLVDCDRRYMD